MSKIERRGAHNDYYYDDKIVEKEDYKELQFKSDVENDEFTLHVLDIRGRVIDNVSEKLNVKEITDYPGLNKYVITDTGRIIRCTGFSSYRIIDPTLSDKWEYQTYTTTEVIPDKNTGRVRIQGARDSRNRLWEKYWPEEYRKAHPVKSLKKTIPDLPGEKWKLIVGTDNVFISNLKRIKSVSKYGNERIINNIKTIEGNYLSKISVLKNYWNIDIYWDGDEIGEEWRGVDGVSDIEVSNLGRIRTTNYKDTGTKKLLKTWILNGYEYISYRDDKGRFRKRTVHRLVGLAFVPNDDPINNTEIDHINTIRNDNRAENLRWTDHIGNMNNPITVQKRKEKYS